MKTSNLARLSTINQIKNCLAVNNNGPETGRKLTDRQLLAHRCGISVSHVSNMLNGNRNVTFRFMNEAKTLAERNIQRGVIA
jgi:hypothetical protein